MSDGRHHTLSGGVDEVEPLDRSVGSVRVAASSLAAGRGVFARRPIIEGETIECCPALVFPKDDRPHIDRTGLYDYYFDWSDGGLAVALGYGSLYNHSYSPNAMYLRDVILGDAGNDVLLGGQGDDNLRGGVGEDRLIGNAGADTLAREGGQDNCAGETERSCEAVAGPRG